MATITKRNTGTWQARVRIHGYPQQVKTFDRKRDAEDWARDVETLMKRGDFDESTESKRNTLADMVDRFIREDTNKDKKKTAVLLQWWRGELGDYSLQAVSPKVISVKREKLARRKNRQGNPISQATINRYLAALSAAFTAAVGWHWLDSHPMTNKKIVRKPEAKGRVRFLTDDERKALLDTCEGDLYLIVVLALTTGMRRGEIRNLRWSDLDLVNKRIILRDTKNTETRAAYLSGETLKLMRARTKVRPLHDGYVFAGSGLKSYDFDRDFADAAKRAEIRDFRFHDCRHTAASYLAMSGATLTEISAILGHKTLSMVKRYAHLAEDHQSKAVERMVKRFLQ